MAGAVRREESSPAGSWLSIWWVAVPALAAVSLQGCDGTAVMHSVANWRLVGDYLIAYEYVPPTNGTEVDIAQAAVLNSCAPDSGAPLKDRCSGHGLCREFSYATPGTQQAKVAFCECDRDWADPECRTPRSSQMVAFAWSLTFGYLGLDAFYLGYPVVGCFKLLTLGGLGLWWVYDIIRIGCAPVYAADYRLAPDLPHYLFVIVTAGFFLTLGWGLAGLYKARVLAQKKRLMMLAMKAEMPELGTPELPDIDLDLNFGELGLPHVNVAHVADFNMGDLAGLDFADIGRLDIPSYGSTRETTPGKVKFGEL